MAERSARRTAPRIAVDREVIVEIDGARYPGRLVDVSTGGAFVRLSVELLSTQEVQIELPDGTARASADVRRVAEGGFGIRFSDAERARMVSEWAQQE